LRVDPPPFLCAIFYSLIRYNLINFQQGVPLSMPLSFSIPDLWFIFENPNLPAFDLVGNRCFDRRALQHGSADFYITVIDN
jgi:hypothetical protein